MRVLKLALAALAHILGIGRHAQQPVLEIGGFGLQRGQGVVARWRIADARRVRLDRFRLRLAVFAFRFHRSPNVGAGATAGAGPSVAVEISGQQPADYLRRVVDDRDDPRIIDPRRADHADRSDDLLIAVFIRRHHQ